MPMGVLMDSIALQLYWFYEERKCTMLEEGIRQRVGEER